MDIQPYIVLQVKECLILSIPIQTAKPSIIDLGDANVENSSRKNVSIPVLILLYLWHKTASLPASPASGFP